MMGVSTLSDVQCKKLAKVVAGEHVRDFGAGDLRLSKLLLLLGAKTVEAIDKEYSPAVVEDSRTFPGLTVTTGRFSEVPVAQGGMAFVGWPQNNAQSMVELLPHLEHARIVIYLGSNCNGLACGSTVLFGYFLWRMVLGYDPGQKGTLLVLGAGKGRRLPYGEELAGLTPEVMMTTEEAEAIAWVRGARTPVGGFRV